MVINYLPTWDAWKIEKNIFSGKGTNVQPNYTGGYSA